MPIFPSPLAPRLEEVLEKDGEMALAGAGPAAGDEKRQELEALKEEQRADADELDGDAELHGEWWIYTIYIYTMTIEYRLSIIYLLYIYIL